MESDAWNWVLHCRTVRLIGSNCTLWIELLCVFRIEIHAASWIQLHTLRRFELNLSLRSHSQSIQTNAVELGFVRFGKHCICMGFGQEFGALFVNCEAGTLLPDYNVFLSRDWVAGITPEITPTSISRATSSIDGETKMPMKPETGLLYAYVAPLR